MGTKQKHIPGLERKDGVHTNRTIRELTNTGSMSFNINNKHEHKFVPRIVYFRNGRVAKLWYCAFCRKREKRKRKMPKSWESI